MSVPKVIRGSNSTCIAEVYKWSRGMHMSGNVTCQSQQIRVNRHSALANLDYLYGNGITRTATRPVNYIVKRPKLSKSILNLDIGIFC